MDASAPQARCVSVLEGGYKVTCASAMVKPRTRTKNNKKKKKTVKKKKVVHSEAGYDCEVVPPLARCVAAHVSALMRGKKDTDL